MIMYSREIVTLTIVTILHSQNYLSSVFQCSNYEVFLYLAKILVLYLRNMSASEGPYFYAFLMFAAFNLSLWTVIKAMVFNVASSFAIISSVFEMLACGYY